MSTWLFAEFNIDDALRVSKEEGMQEGIEKNRTETAMNLLQDGLSIARISKVTDLTEKVIEKLRDDLAKSDAEK